MTETRRVSELLAEAFIGSRRVRFGPRPSPANHAHLVGLIEQSVRAGRPVPVLVNWGGAKCYSQNWPLVADLYDLLAVERLTDLHREACGAYQPGVAVTILFEDWTEQQLAGKAGLAYCASMALILKAAGAGHARVVRESELIPSGLDMAARNNAQAILFGGHAAVGWQGDIDWEFYLGRARSEHPDECDGKLRVRVAHYLGIALARHQFKVFPPDHVRLSFCPFPRGVPDALRRHRVEWKTRPSSNSNKTTPPWAGYGCIRPDSLERTHVSVNERRAGQFHSSSFDYNGYNVHYLYPTKFGG